MLVSSPRTRICRQVMFIVSMTKGQIELRVVWLLSREHSKQLQYGTFVSKESSANTSRRVTRGE